MTLQFLHIDAENSALFARSLEFIKTETFDEKPLPLKGFSLVPMSSNLPAWADRVTWRAFKEVGIARFCSDYGSGNIPNVNVLGTEQSQPIRMFESGFAYNIQELAQASGNNTNLPARKAVAARNMVEQLLHKTVLMGDAASGLNGLLNYPGFTSYTIPADGTGSSKLWSTKTPAQIIRDIRGVIDAVVVTTKGAENPNAILMPQAAYSLLATTLMSATSSDTTILEFAKRNFPDIKRWEWLSELDTLGSGSTGQLMACTMDNKHIEFEVPVPFQMLPYQTKGFTFEVPCYGRTGGVICYYPLAFSTAYGI